MRHLLRIVFLVYLCAGSAPPCVADSTAELRKTFTHMPLPEYPRQFHVEGTVVVRVSLDARGAVTRVHVVKSTGDKIIDAATTEVLRHWRARPGPAGRFFDIPFHFTKRGHDSLKKPSHHDGLGLTKGSDAGK